MQTAYEAPLGGEGEESRGGALKLESQPSGRISPQHSSPGPTVWSDTSPHQGIPGMKL